MSVGYREKCISEKGKECKICDSPYRIEVHHIDGDRDNNSLENLVPLCQWCHRRIHEGASNYAKWHNALNDLRTRRMKIRCSEDSLRTLRGFAKGANISVQEVYGIALEHLAQRLEIQGTFRVSGETATVIENDQEDEIAEAIEQ